MRYKLVWFVPESDLEKTKTAVFNAGAGAWGGYAQVCWQTKGIGQFIPKTGTNPHIGQPNQLSKVDEWRVEVLCPEYKINAVLDALLKVHPYEKPAIEYWPILLGS
jgi:hypothetical protein